MKLVRCEGGELPERAGVALNELLQNSYGTPTLLLLSGGSALTLLSRIKGSLLGEHLTIGVTDERYSRDQEVNNFAQIAAMEFYEAALRRKAAFIDTRVNSGESAEGLAVRFEKSLREWRDRNPEGKILVTQGIGPDGHTCGIMPYPENPEEFNNLFLNENVWVRSYDAGAKSEFPLRITITVPFLRLVTHSIVYVAGESKREALRRGVAQEGSLAETPARILREMKDAVVFTDLN